MGLGYHSVAAVGSLALLVAGACWYVWTLVRKKNRRSTQWSSWLVWSFTSGMNYLTYHGSGARESAWAALAYMIYCSVVAVVALLLKSEGGVTRTDGICVALAMAGGGVMLSATAVYGQVVSVLAEVIGYVPILRDYREEDPVAWSLDFGSNVVNMAAVSALTFGLLLYPTVIMACNGVVVWLVIRQRRRLRQDVASTGRALAASPR